VVPSAASLDRFSPDGVYRNQNSPVTYLNQDRYANVKLPKNANVKAQPHWIKVSSGKACVRDGGALR
jgi:hypothetical protein